VSRFQNIAPFTDWRIDGGKIVSFGMREFAYANDNYLAASQIHHKYTAWHAVRDHVISGATVSQPRYGYYGQEPCGCTFGCADACCTNVKSRGAWANYVGRDTRYRSSFNNRDWEIGTNGVQVGTDFFRTHRHQFGMFFGYENSTGKNVRDSIKANDYYVGLYDVHVFQHGADLRTVFNFGWQDYDSLRTSPISANRMKFEGYTAELNVELGKRYYSGGGYGGGVWSTRPVLAIDWYMNRLGGGTEGGDATQALRYGARNISQLFFRFGTDLRYEHGPWALETGLFYSYDMRGAELWTPVWDSTGAFGSTLLGSKTGRSVLSYNVGGSWAMCRNFTLFGGYRAEVTPDRAGRDCAHIGYVGGAWRW